MTLDPKRTFDELIERLAPDEETRDEILGNRIYQQLSGAVAGSQEFTAVAKLYDLHASGRFDVLVLDTPPSRNALDFLDAPDRLTGFFDGRALKLFLAPTGLAARAMGRGTGVVFGVLRRLTGVDLLDDLVGLLPRARRPGRRLPRARRGRQGAAGRPRDRRSSSSPARSASPSRRRSSSAASCASPGCRSAALIVNRVHTSSTPAADGCRRRRRSPPSSVEELGPRLAAKVARTYGEALATAERDAAAIERLCAETGERDPVIVPELEGDVHDVAGLVAVHEHLFGA